MSFSVDGVFPSPLRKPVPPASGSGKILEFLGFPVTSGFCPKIWRARFGGCSIHGDELILVRLASRIAANKNQNRRGARAMARLPFARRAKEGVAVASLAMRRPEGIMEKLLSGLSRRRLLASAASLPILAATADGRTI